MDMVFDSRRAGAAARSSFLPAQSICRAMSFTFDAVVSLTCGRPGQRLSLSETRAGGLRVDRNWRFALS